MINIYSSGEKIYVWNAADVLLLRKQHHIVGSLAGILPSRPFQIQTKWLPLQLMQEEACLLIEKGIAKLISSLEKVTDPDLIKSYFEKRDQLCEEQAKLLKENRKKTILEKADEIFEGKKRKYMKSKSEECKEKMKVFEESAASQNDKEVKDSHFTQTPDSTNKGETTEKPSAKKVDERTSKADAHDNSENQEKKLKLSLVTNESDMEQTESMSCEDISRMSESDTGVDSSIDVENLDKKTVIDAELAKVTDVSKDLCMVQLFTECPWKNASAVVSLPFPSSEEDKLRYAVFKDLWEKNYYITVGTKFGGDYLVYEGDPLKYHAAFIVVCIHRSTKLQAVDVLTYGRLGHQVKKTVALASVNESGTVEYISVNWASDLL